MKTPTLLLAAIIALAIPAFAQSSKFTAKTANLVLLPKSNGNGQWVTLMSNKLKTAQSKDLIISVSAEVGLFTATKTASKGMIDDTSVGQAEVECQVLLDGKPVEPGTIVLGRRSQTLTTTLEGSIGGCLISTNNADGTISTTVDLACVTPENVSLILDSLQAASFNFIAVDVPQGTHTVSIQGRVSTIGSQQFGSFSALAFIGKGSFWAESIRLVKSPDVILEVP